MIEFILNNQKISTDKPNGALLIDFIRHTQHLCGTKIGCREGDCGACTVLVGTYKKGAIQYRQIPSCLTPIGNVAGKHVVTVEGLNMDDLSPVQQTLVNESGTQCGFCTPGFVVALSQHCLSQQSSTYEDAIASISGNICRCTGYKPIERTAEKITTALKNKNTDQVIEWLVENDFIPNYFLDIPKRLSTLTPTQTQKTSGILVGGGTDLYVQKHDTLSTLEVDLVANHPELKYIKIDDYTFYLGSALTVTDLLESKAFRGIFSRLSKQMKLISSAMIRNVSTLAGNFVNASPIGDMTAFFIALNARIVLSDHKKERTILLKDLYKGYKDLDKTEQEIITEIQIDIPKVNGHFNFEKVSKRTHLDIASVNSAALLIAQNGVIDKAHISAGGVGPIPIYLEQTSSFLQGKRITPQTILDANDVLQTEISPISDIRGSESYKRLLLRQLFFAHFVELFPNDIKLSDLV